MYEKIIRNYIYKMSVEDIKNFALKRNIELTTEESILIFKFLKNNYEELLRGNTDVFEQIRPYIRGDVYQYGYHLYQDLYTKYLK